MSRGLLEVTGRLVDASNATLYANCTYDEKTFPVIYKPIAGERPLWDFEDGNLAQREVAAYLLSEIGGFHLVPLTILRDGPFGEGMVQLWIEIDQSIDLALFYSSDDSRLRSMALFDAIINNTDRKIGHLLPDANGKLYGCDHGVTFHSEDKLRTVLWQWAGQPFSEQEIVQLSQLLKALHQNESQFSQLITSEEYLALLARITKLLSGKVFPSPSDEWPPVPWPPF